MVGEPEKLSTGFQFPSYNHGGHGRLPMDLGVLVAVGTLSLKPISNTLTYLS
jgi:hypothetical protein